MKVLFFYRECENLGVEYLISFLKKAGHKCYLLFDSGAGEVEYEIKPLKKILDYKQKMIELTQYYNPDLVVFSSITNLFPWICDMGKSIKKVMDVPIIIGGIHPTIVPEFVISQDFVDMICIGEGEHALLELVNSMEKGSIDYSIRNIWFKKKDGKIIKNPLRPLIHDLDTLPFPDKELFRQYGAFSMRYITMTSRGCPNSCTYCLNHQLKRIYHGKGKYLRRRSVDNVIAELKTAKSKYKFKIVYFYDDIFIDSTKWLKEFAEKYPKEVGIKFKCLLHPLSINKERVKLLKKAGCVDIDIGIESGNEKIRKELLNRNFSNSQIINSINIIKNEKIRISTLNMIGFPGETPKDMIDTYKLNALLKPNGVLISHLYPYPETDIYNLCKDMGLIDDSMDKMILSGADNYRRNHFLKHKHLDVLKRIQHLTPIAVKFPKFLHKYIFQLPLNEIIQIIGIFGITSYYSAYSRLYQFITTILKTHSFYQNIDKLKR